MKHGKCIIAASFLAVLLFGMSACGNSSDDETSSKKSTSQTTNDFFQSNAPSPDNISEDNRNEPSLNNFDRVSAESENSDENVGDKEEKETLSQYSSEQIEYARIWLQLGENQEIGGLYARQIPAGTPLNPNDDTSAGYPEDVIQLAGSRLVDGSVTYSGNGDGDGTIHIYNVPLRWDGSYPAGKKFYTDIIKNTKQVYIDPGDDEEIIKLIKLLEGHH